MYCGDNDSQEQLFLAHGFDEPKTEKEILAFLFDEYNKERDDRSIEFIAKAQQPHLYNLEQNPLLNEMYTLPRRADNPYGPHFDPASSVSLNEKTLALLKYNEITPRIKLAVMEIKSSSFVE